MNNLINSKSKFRAPNIIDGFPEELLVKIFGFLDWTTPVKTLTLVNKR